MLQRIILRAWRPGGKRERLLTGALLGLSGDVLGDGDAQGIEGVGVDIQPIVLDDLIGQVLAGGFAFENLGGHQARLDAQLDIVQARAGHAAVLHLLDLRTVDGNACRVGLFQNGRQHAHHVVVRQVGQAVHAPGQQGVHRLGDLLLGGHADGRRW